MGKPQDASQVTKEKDPCWLEKSLSLKCLDVNQYDKSLCMSEFENYKNWNKITTYAKFEIAIIFLFAKFAKPNDL